MKKAQSSINESNEKLLSYIKSLTPEQAEEALKIASSWLAEQQEENRHLLLK